MAVEAQISIIIAARNEAKNIKACLNSLLHQQYPYRAFEIIVVDDHSDDDTAIIVESFAERHPDLQLRLIEAGDAYGKKAALAKGVDLAKGDILLTTDADCICGPLWIDTMAGTLLRQDKLLVSGPVMFKESRGFFGLFQQVEFASLIAAGAGAIGIGKPVLCNGANMAYLKSARLRIPHDNLQPQLASGDDVFLLHAFAREYGAGKIGFVKEKAALVMTSAASDVAAFWQQRLRWSGKSTAFKGGGPVITAIIVWLTCFVIFINGLLALFLPRYLPGLLILFSAKTIIDLPLLISYLRFSGQQKLIIAILPVEIMVIVYTTMIGIFSRFVPVWWKGRKIVNV
ncbi:glycosyltransferase [Lentimicrobium sp.]